VSVFSAKPVIGSCLKMLIDWVECVSGQVVKSKQMCYQSMSEIVNITLNIFPVFIHQPGNTGGSGIVEHMHVLTILLNHCEL